jgi:rare lipoprotein A
MICAAVVTLLTVLNPPYYGEPCVASWYGEPFHGRQTASGLIYDQYEMTCAHKTLPLGTLVEFTNITTGRSATLRVTDRGPFNGRDFDLSMVGFKVLATGGLKTGVEKASLRCRITGQDISDLLYP